MSRTDKTRPYWVQLRDPGFPWPIREVHYHHGCFGTTPQCDIDFPLPMTRGLGLKGCEYRPRYGDYEKVWGRRRYRRSLGSFQDRRVRMDLRRLRASWLKETDREEIDSTQSMPTSRWRWRRWWWD